MSFSMQVYAVGLSLRRKDKFVCAEQMDSRPNRIIADK